MSSLLHNLAKTLKHNRKTSVEFEFAGKRSMLRLGHIERNISVITDLL